MKKWWSLLIVTGFLLSFAGIACAQGEANRQVEMFRKPGVDFKQFKTVGNDVAVNLSPGDIDWTISKSDPFLSQRIQQMSLAAAKNQGWLTADNVDADLKLSVKVTQWGRIQNVKDPNLMEFLTFELKVYAKDGAGQVYRGTGKYSRIAPADPSLDKVNEAFSSIMEELLAALHTD